MAEERLTPEQQAAVSNRGGKLLVSAAAGSGKTKVLVDRLLSYLEDPNDPANVDEFLIITYTKAAAAELRGKIAAKLTQKIANNPENRHLQQQIQRLYLAKISTVHSFCADILREYAYRLDVSSDFRVADENECQEIQYQILDKVLEEAYKSAFENPDFCAFVDSQGFGRDDRLIPEIILKVYNSAKCHLSPDAWLDWCVQSGDISACQDASQTLWGEYLIADLHAYLDMQLDALRKCVSLAMNDPEMAKPAALLQNTVFQLEQLRASEQWDDIVRKSKIDYGRLTFSKKCADQELVERIKAIRNSCKAGLEKKLRTFCDSSEQVLQDLSQSCAAARGLIDLVRSFTREYDKRKRARRILDFADLEHKMLDLVLGKKRSGTTSLAREIGERFREIMVDEYQDSNEVQDAIFCALTEKRQNCFMVGDVKQSIYQFRLADPGIFIDKYNRYQYAEYAKEQEGRKILLSKNFRSGGGVIHAVNDVFTCCMSKDVGGLEYGEAECLREGIEHVVLPDPEIELYGIDVQQDTYAEEASFVANRIYELLNEQKMIRDGDKLRPITPDDIVILLRSPGSVGMEFSYALEQRGIRCATGGNSDLLQTEEISVLRSILQIISNPLQDIPLIAAMSSRVFAFTADELAAIRSANKQVPFYDAVKLCAIEKVQTFVSLLNSLRKIARLYTLPQLLQQIFQYTKLDSIYASMTGGEEKTENLQTFCQLAANYESSGRKDLEQFLDHLTALEKKGLSAVTEQKVSGAVTIMSIHKSKGLEFPVVFLCGLSRGFNHESAKSQVLCDKTLGIGLSCVDSKNRVRYPTISKRAISVKMISDGISEEMRVLYVAMTRPKDRLIMTYAAKNLEKDIQDITLRMDFSGKQLMTSQVDCPGTWVLQSALGRTEAGALFALGGKPDCVCVCDPFWHIAVVDGKIGENNPSVQIETQERLPKHAEDILRSGLQFQYNYTSATTTPSKQTATQLKGRTKDMEASENCNEIRPYRRNFRKPGFADQTIQGKDYGSAIHAVLQYLSFENCANINGVHAELDRLVSRKLITLDQASVVDCDQIVNLATSNLGQKICTSQNVLREFKFSILDDAGAYAPDLAGEQILLQGVVDSAIIEPDGITVIDFKTDHVTHQNLLQLVEQYKPQVQVYAKALQKIYCTNIKAAYLYFFQINEFIEVIL